MLVGVTKGGRVFMGDSVPDIMNQVHYCDDSDMMANQLDWFNAVPVSVRATATYRVIATNEAGDDYQLMVTETTL